MSTSKKPEKAKPKVKSKPKKTSLRRAITQIDPKPASGAELLIYRERMLNS
jgi:hypothetical protein